MDTKSIQNAVKKVPFEPIKLRMNDGREYYVPHPEFIAVSRRVVYVIDPEDESGISLEPILIASMEFVKDGSKTADPGPNPPANNDQN